MKKRPVVHFPKEGPSNQEVGDNEFISLLKSKAYRNRKYLDWLKTQRCWSCRGRGDDTYNPMTPSHIFRGYFGLKNHDWGSIPQCSTCHWQYEYFKNRFQVWHRLPGAKDAETYFQQYLKLHGLSDDRLPNQMMPL